jgi:T-box protein 3
MFPVIQVRARNLQPAHMYNVYIDFVCVDNHRYRYAFHQSRWTIAGVGDAQSPPRIYRHPDSPATGERWMSQMITFDKLKLTNNQLDANAYVSVESSHSRQLTTQIILNSMHLYQPRVHISQDLSW